MQEERFPKLMMNYWSSGTRNQGQPLKTQLDTWDQTVTEEPTHWQLMTVAFIFTLFMQCMSKAHPNVFWVHVGQINFSNIHVATVGPSDAILWLESIHGNSARVVIVPRSPRVCHLLVLVPQLQHETDTSFLTLKKVSIHSLVSSN
jgi:hypothetical protein